MDKSLQIGRGTVVGGEPDLLVSVDVGAALLGMSVASFWRLVADGTIPEPLKLGRLSRWPRSELVAVIEKAKAARASGGRDE